MIDILIKSFNRPYYLDRCLYSIHKLVSGDYKITILDDGTPERYLEKIKEKYPLVNIIKSKSYTEKNKAIEENLATGKEINGFQIPIDMWKEAVKNASDYFIMTEDDVWFTEKIDVNTLESIMKEYQMVLIKLGWISNRPIQSEIKKIENTEVQFIIPHLFTAPRFVIDLIFNNTMKFNSLLRRLKITNSGTKNEYWIMNALLMGLFKKEYWLEIWNNINNKVDENMQLKNAIQWYRKNKNNPYNFGKLEQLKMNTTFVSSATNSYHKYGVDCDINRFNHIINEVWYNDRFDSLNSFPKDISEEHYITFLNEANHPKCSVEAWKKWADKFKEQYRKQGVIVD